MNIKNTLIFSNIKTVILLFLFFLALAQLFLSRLNQHWINFLDNILQVIQIGRQKDMLLLIQGIQLQELLQKAPKNSAFFYNP